MKEPIYVYICIYFVGEMSMSNFGNRDGTICLILYSHLALRFLETKKRRGLVV